MSERDDLTKALHRLRAAVREQVPAPATATVRAAAQRQLRVRRTAVAALAAVAVAAIAFGGAAVLQPAAAPPVSPAGSPSPAPTESAQPSPERTQEPTGALTPQPFTDVNWQDVTIDIPPQEGCPSGPVSLAPTDDELVTGAGPAGSYPQILLTADLAAYGDLTGDGRAEAVLGVYCATSEEESYDGEGQLLAISRDPDGSLRGIGWVGPRGAIYHSAWITDGALYVEAHPWHGEGFEWALGVALRYEWYGDGFGDYEWAPEYPPILPADEAETGPPVRLGAVAAGLACPNGTVQFGRDGTATVDGATYDLTQPSVPSSGPHLVDLNQTGDRLLLLAIECQGTRGLGVFERTAAGFVGISVLLPPESRQIISWELEPIFDGEQLLVTLDPDGGGLVAPAYQWTGTEFRDVGG